MTVVLTVLLSFIVMIVVVAAMAIGVMAGRQPIKGSCGGLNSGGCELCSGNCPEQSKSQQA